MGNRSLDDFLDAGDDDAGDDTGSVETGDRDRDGEATGTDGEGATDAKSDDDRPGPAVSTYAWYPGGGECAACGAAVERRWRQDDDLVCPDCKEW